MIAKVRNVDVEATQYSSHKLHLDKYYLIGKFDGMLRHCLIFNLL